MAIDAPGLFDQHQSVLSAASIYAVGYLANERNRGEHHDYGGFGLVNFPRASFAGCLAAFLATMTLVAVSQHFGLMWVGVEATTLASAPLIYFHRQHRSLEATWKYLLICSVGIALALLGNFLLAVSMQSVGEPTIHLSVDDSSSTPTASDKVGSRRRFCSFWSATARRWAWPRCTPGCPTRTANRPRSFPPCSPARC